MKKNKPIKSMAKRKINILLGIIALVLVLNFNGLLAGTINIPSYTKSNLTSGLSTLADTVTKSFAVAGKGACKSSIEGALTTNAGVLSASWDSTTQIITVTFIKHIIKKTHLHRLLASAGYDNANARAKDDIYAALPAACQYTRLPVTVYNTAN